MPPGGGVMKSLILVILAVCCNAGAQVALKQAAMGELGHWQAWFKPSLFLGAGLYVTSFIVTVKVYADYDLSLISPVMAGAIFVLVTIAAHFLFAESLTFSKLAGIACIVAGIALLARGH